MQPSLEPADASERIPIMHSNREVNEISVTKGYFNLKIIIIATEICNKLYG